MVATNIASASTDGFRHLLERMEKTRSGVCSILHEDSLLAERMCQMVLAIVPLTEGKVQPLSVSSPLFASPSLAAWASFVKEADGTSSEARTALQALADNVRRLPSEPGGEPVGCAPWRSPGQAMTGETLFESSSCGDIIIPPSGFVLSRSGSSTDGDPEEVKRSSGRKLLRGFVSLSPFHQDEPP